MITETWHHFTVNTTDTEPDDWSAWCESAVPAWLESNGCQDGIETVRVRAASRDAARELLEDQLRGGMFIEDES